MRLIRKKNTYLFQNYSQVSSVCVFLWMKLGSVGFALFITKSNSEYETFTKWRKDYKCSLLMVRPRYNVPAGIHLHWLPAAAYCKHSQQYHFLLSFFTWGFDPKVTLPLCAQVANEKENADRCQVATGAFSILFSCLSVTRSKKERKKKRLSCFVCLVLMFRPSTVSFKINLNGGLISFVFVYYVFWWFWRRNSGRLYAM